MLRSKYQQKVVDDMKQEALRLYQTGLSTREIAKELGKSHTWVWYSVRDLEKKLSPLT